MHENDGSFILRTAFSALKDTIVSMVVATVIFYALFWLMLLWTQALWGALLFLAFLAVFPPWYVSITAHLLMHRWLKDEKPSIKAAWGASCRMLGKFVGTAMTYLLVFVIGMWILLAVFMGGGFAPFSPIVGTAFALWFSFLVVLYLMTGFVIVITKRTAFQAIGKTFQYLIHGGILKNMVVVASLTVAYSGLFTALFQNRISETLLCILFALAPFVVLPLLYAAYRHSQTIYADWRERGIKFKAGRHSKS